MDSRDLVAEGFRLIDLLDQALAYLREQVKDAAQSENDYRLAKAQAWVEAPEGTVPEREAFVNGITADARRRRDVADGMRQAALEAVRSRRQQISFVQTALNVEKSEADFARTGPER